jgi:hypothetical protein
MAEKRTAAAPVSFAIFARGWYFDVARSTAVSIAVLNASHIQTNPIANMIRSHWSTEISNQKLIARTRTVAIACSHELGWVRKIYTIPDTACLMACRRDLK